MILATPILSDAATVTGSPSAGSLPVTNLQVQDPKQVWRATDATAAYVEIDLGAAYAIDLIGLLSHNASYSASCRVRAATSQPNLTASPGYDSGLLPARSHQSGYDAAWLAGVSDPTYGALDKNHFIKWLSSSPQTYRWWRLDINDPSSSGGYFDAGRLYISNAWQPATNIDYGIAEGIVDNSRKNRSRSGVMTSVELTKFRYAEFNLSFASETEMFDNAFEIERLRGRTKDILFMPDPTMTNNLQRRTIHGLMENLQPIVNANFALFQKSFRIEELVP